MKFQITYFSLFIFLITTSIFAISSPSSLDNAMNKKAVNCWDIWYNAGNFIVKYSADNNLDSIKIIKEYWKEKCGYNEPLMRLDILEAIINKESVEKFLDSNSISKLVWYKNRKNSLKEAPENFRRINNWYNYALEPSFDSLTINMARSINIDNLSFTEELFVNFYLDSFNLFFEQVYSAPKANIISKLVYAQIKKAQNIGELTMGLNSGVWIPFGNLEKVGNHPYLGVFMGGKYKRFILDLNTTFKFLKSKESYTVLQNNIYYDKNDFVCSYIAIEPSFILFQHNKHNINLLTGIAYDGWAVLFLNKEENTEYQSIGGLNLNFGLGYQFFYSTFGNLGIDLRYNFNNFKNEGGTDFSGNALTLGFRWGFSGNIQKINIYKNLEYKNH